MTSYIEAKRAMRDLADRAARLVDDRSLSNAQKKSALDKIDVELAAAQGVLLVRQASNRLMVGGSSLGSTDGDVSFGSKALKGRATPALVLTQDEQKALYQAAKSGQNLTIDLKDATSADATRTQLPAQFIGLVDRRTEPTRLLDHVPSSPMAGPSIEFISHVSNQVGIGAPVITLGSAVAGGTFVAGTYFWKLTATNAAGESLGSNEITGAVGLNQKQTFTWPAVAGSSGYRAYRGTAGGGENVLVAVIAGGATATYTDLGGVGTFASVPLVDRTSGATTVHAGGQMPEVSLTTVATILVAKKLAVFTTVPDELLSGDFEAFSQYLSVELTREIVSAENAQVLSGSGVGDDVLGLLNTPGTLSRAKQAGDTALDVIEMGISDLRNGPSYSEPDVLVVHPLTWSAIRRTKNTLGGYLLGDPGQVVVADVWGTPVLVTSQMVPGTVILANLEAAAQGFIREGAVVTMSNSADGDFTAGKVKLRITERFTLGVARPTAINILTGF